MLTELQDIIRGYDVISFDIFDTLLIRDVLKPEDIWHKMENHLGRRGFAEARKKADAVTYAEATRNDCEHTFQGIYDVMGKQWADCLDEELVFEHAR